MLEFKSVTLQNFWSYGNYPTTIELDDLGPCLITGTVNEDEEDEINSGKVSNGAGKSALVGAIMWCLFGRTTRSPNPGDKVMNWFTKKYCIVTLRFKNGDVLSRSRNVDGHNELLLTRGGEDISLGTTNMEQQRLNRILNLDWEIFHGSTFFSQFGKSWMEISDTKRKDAMEREFHMDNIQFYADDAKNKLNAAKVKQQDVLTQISGLKDLRDTCSGQIDHFIAASKRFDVQKQLRVKQANAALADLVAQRDDIKQYDVAILTKHWDLFEQVQVKLQAMQQAVYKMEDDIRHNRLRILDKEKLIAKWQGKSEVCSECEQPISKDHIAGKIRRPAEDVADLTKIQDTLQKTFTTKRDSLNTATDASEAKRPSTTLKQAAASKKQFDAYAPRIKSQQKSINVTATEENHYDETIAELRAKVKKYNSEVDGLNKTVIKLNSLILHLNYNYKAYHDRRKIKSYMLSEYIPYLNNRVAHYSAKFGLDIAIEFTNALGVKNSHWGYENFSGGEAKRFDVALMLAMFDLHTLMYGRHCNIVVLDEVDGRLDERGAKIFFEIVRTEFASKVDSILVISQRPDIRGALPSEIHVVREDRFSKISEIIK